MGSYNPPFPVVAGDFLTGNGSPEGVLIAPVGAVYIDEDATNGAVQWVKASGVGNTGWRVVYGNTSEYTIVSWTGGVQDAVNQIGTINTSNWTLVGTGSIRLQRVNQTVYLTIPGAIDNTIRSVGTGGDLFTASIFPAGFLRTDFGATALAASRFSNSVVYVRQNAAGHFAISTPLAGYDLLALQVNWPTADTWPSVLPGTFARPGIKTG